MSTLDAAQPKGTMFQLLGNCGMIEDFYLSFGHKRDYYIDKKIYGNCRGDLGASIELDDLQSKDVSSTAVGSVKFSFEVTGIKVSALIFNTGSCKLCGGFPPDVKSSHDSNSYNVFLDECKQVFDQIHGLKIHNAKLICVNGQFRIGKKLNNLNELDCFVRKHRHKFDRIREPNLDVSGRRGAYKLYLYSDRKTHIAIDYKGVCQVFACKTPEELFQCFQMLS